MDLKGKICQWSNYNHLTRHNKAYAKNTHKIQTQFQNTHDTFVADCFSYNIS